LHHGYVYCAGSVDWFGGRGQRRAAQLNLAYEQSTPAPNEVPAGAASLPPVPSPTITLRSTNQRDLLFHELYFFSRKHLTLDFFFLMGELQYIF